MTREDIIRMAREAGFEPEAVLEGPYAIYAKEWLNNMQHFAALVAAANQPAQQQEPVAAECKFDREQKWVRCEIAHHHLVQSEPHNWPGYQTRLLYTSPPAQPSKPLTDEQRNWIVATCPTPRHIIDTVEKMHGIKE